jgi:hypothetical protein
MRPGTAQEVIDHKDEVEAHNSQLEADQNKGRRKEEKPRMLITDPDQLPKVLIETRGKGGYIGTVPGPGYSLDVGDLEHIPTLTVDQRDTLINSCKAFNLVIKYSQKSKVDRKIYSLHQRKGDSFTGTPSWEDYHEKSDPVSLLTERGWVISHENPAQVFLRRPGKSQGWSADYHKDRKILAVWTTSTNLEDKHYSPFALYTELVHNGDFSAAAKQLYAEGYGDRQTGDQVQPAEVQRDKPRVGTVQDPSRKGGPALDLQGLIQKAEKTRFDYSAPIRNIKACVKLKGLDGTTRKMASFGHMGLWLGKSGHGKTFALSHIAASALSGGYPMLNFRTFMMGRKILWIETEQPDTFYQINQKRIFDQAGVSGNRPDYIAYNLDDFTKMERFKIIEHYVNTIEGLGMLIIDGVVDICHNFNDLEKSEYVVDTLRRWRTEKNLLIHLVLHLNKGDGKARGMLGSLLLDKCDFVCKVTQLDTKNYSLHIPKSRFGPLPAFDFWRDSDGLGRTENDGLDEDPDTEGLIPMLEAKGAKVIRKSFQGQQTGQEGGKSVFNQVADRLLEDQEKEKTNDDDDIPF